MLEYASPRLHVTVEALNLRLGLAGAEDEVVAEASLYKATEEVVDSATRTGVELLAISIGTLHGAARGSSQSSAHVTPKTLQ